MPFSLYLQSQFEWGWAPLGYIALDTPTVVAAAIYMDTPQTLMG